MATVSFRVPDEVKSRMDEHDEINWSAVLRSHIEEELAEMEERNLARAVATSERLSRQIDPADVANQNTADAIRAWRNERYGPTTTE